MRPDAEGGLDRSQAVQPRLCRMGDMRLHKLFAPGASTLMHNARSRTDRATTWQRGMT